MMSRVRSVLKNWRPVSDRSCIKVRNHSLPLQSLRQFSGIETTAPFALSYLIDECGLRPEKAAAAVKYLRFKTPERPNAVLQFFRDLGFSSTEIARIIGRRPTLLDSIPEKHFVPKIGLLESNGFSPSNIATILLRAPQILHSSLERQLLPNLNFFKEVIPFKDRVVTPIIRCPMVLTCNLETYLIPSMKMLRESGVGDLTIARLLLFNPTRLLMPQGQLSETIRRLKEMGMDPKLGVFGTAIGTIGGMSKEKWESKVDAYKKWGWSEELVFSAFAKTPKCMGLSLKKLKENMDYYVDEMGFDALDIARQPWVLTISFKKRIVPRDAVLCILLSKGLVKSRCSFQALKISDEMFEKRFLVPYKEEAPELLELFRSKIGAG